jgi:hypothetical protein
MLEIEAEEGKKTAHYGAANLIFIIAKENSYYLSIT